MNRKRTLIIILILFTGLFPLIPIPIAKASEATVSIENSEDDVWMTESGNIFGYEASVRILEPEIGIRSFLRFEDVPLLKSSKINYATLNVYAGFDQGEQFSPGAMVTIYGIDEPDCAPFSYSGRVWSLERPYTSAYVNWNVSDWHYSTWQSVNVTSIVKEIINQYAWEQNNSIGFQIIGASDSDYEYRTFEDIDHQHHGAYAYLHFHYDVIEEEDEPPGEPDPVFVEQYDEYTIWEINGTEMGLEGWNFRRLIDISGCDVNLTDLQVEINLGADLFPSLPENAPTYQNTPTSDATNQTVHPSVLYFPDGWNGYKYWMVYTPYPAGNPATETPEIVACNDGVNWVVPDGLTNPVVARDANDPNSDPCLFYNEDTDEIWLYYRKADSDGMVWDRIYLKKSSDGVNWGGTGQGTLLLDLAYNQALSPAIVKVGSIYHMWYVDARNGNTLEHRTSADGESWGAETTDNIYGVIPSGKEPWHFEIRYLEDYSVYWMLLSVCNIGASGASSILTFARSVDGTNWYLHDEVFLNLGIGGNWDDNAIYKTTAILDGSDFKIWYSARKSAGGLWHIGYTNTTINLDALQMIGSMKDDLGDVRFTTDDGVTEIPYYIDLPALTAWVKVPSILAIPDNATIYIYYGNPTAETTSNGTATFIDFNPMDNLTLFDDRFDKKSGNDRALDNTTYGRTMIKLPDTDGGGSTSYNATISWSNNSTYILEYYYSAEATGGTTYPYGGVYGRGNNGASGLWLTGPRGGNIDDENDLWSGDHYIFGTFEEDTVWQWQVILNGSSRTVLNVLVEDGDEYTTDRGWGAAFDHDEWWLDAVGTVATGSAWFGAWWIRQYCSLQPTTGEWGENETDVDPYLIVTDENGTVIPTNGNFTDIDDLKDWIDDNLLNGGDPLDPDPGTQGWDIEGPFTRFNMRLYFLIIGLGCIFGPLWAMGYKKMDSIGYAWCALLMILGTGLLWSITGI